jgi:ketosteroid isomerase-like protein
MDEHENSIARITRLEETVAVLQAERSILATLYGYSNAIDRRASAEWASYFTSDATLVGVDVDGKELVKWVGREEIAAFADFHTDKFLFRHGVAHSRIKVDGDRAHVSSGYTLITGDDADPMLSAWGNYEDDMVKEADGVWRFETRLMVSLQIRPQLSLFRESVSGIGR